MSTVAPLVLDRLAPAVGAGSYSGAALAELSTEPRSQLQLWQASPWLTSPALAEFYCDPTAQRVSYPTSPGGDILEASFYREENWPGLFKSFSLIGAAQPNSRLLQKLASSRPMDLLRVPFPTASALHDLRLGQIAPRIRQMVEGQLIDLPGTAGEYLKTLGSQTRNHLPHYLRRLRKEWGSGLRVECPCGSQFTVDSYHGLLALNGLRIDRKSRKSLWTEEISCHRWDLVRGIGSRVSIFRGSPHALIAPELID